MVFLDELGTVEQVVDLNSYMSHAYRIASYDGQLIISGLTEEALDYALVKMDMDGTVVWGKTTEAVLAITILLLILIQMERFSCLATHFLVLQTGILTQ